VDSLPDDIRPKDYKLGNSNGRLFLVLVNRPMELFSTSLDGEGNMHTTPNEPNLNKINVKPELAQAWVTAATRAAVRVRQ
jgi:hypothetical protein